MDLSRRWERAEEILGISADADWIRSPYDNARRTYLLPASVRKVVLISSERESHRRNSLYEELQIIQLCAGIDGVPKVLGFRSEDSVEALELERISGAPLKVCGDYSFWFILKVLAKLAWLQLSLARRGISHNDTTPSNVLVSTHGAVYLVDFDQASIHSPAIAFVRAFFARMAGNSVIHHSFPRFTIDMTLAVLKRYIPRPILDAGKRVLRRSGASTLPKLDAHASEQARLLLQAWRIAQRSNASSPGRELAYYGFEFEGFWFPGERSWKERWSTLSDITNFRGKRTLELGCNLGLLTCNLLKREGASAAIGIDADSEIIRAAELTADALGVDPTFKVIDLDAPVDWEGELSSFQPDIVFALNVLNWVQNKTRLLQFLGRFDELIFEGHDSVDIETSRLEQVGFRTINLVMTTERGRPLIHATK